MKLVYLRLEGQRLEVLNGHSKPADVELKIPQHLWHWLGPHYRRNNLRIGQNRGLTADLIPGTIGVYSGTSTVQLKELDATMMLLQRRFNLSA